MFFARNDELGICAGRGDNLGGQYGQRRGFSPDGVYLAGGDYFGIPGDNPMSDDDGDGIWTISMQMPIGYTGAYTFTNGACGDWSCKENIVGQPCAFGTWSDRELPEVTGDATLLDVLFAVHFHGRDMRFCNRVRCDVPC